MEKIDLFKISLNEKNAPLSLSAALKALWYDAKGNWDAAHELAQEEEGFAGNWVHAYLHRKEGDHFNASYWYSRANRPVCKLSLEEEWESLVKALI
ncbi:MAG: hypothetical protein AAGI07_17925 [Bacteroidota bacterium]